MRNRSCRVIAIAIWAILVTVAFLVPAAPRAEAQNTNTADLDQCENGAAPSTQVTCGWVNGNVNAQKAHYVEGDFISYRMKLDKMTPGAHELVIQWDALKSGKHAIDYIGSFNYTNTGADPCLGLTISNTTNPCTVGNARHSFPIPSDPIAPGNSGNPGGPQIPGTMYLWGTTGSTINSITYLPPVGADASHSAVINFTVGGAANNQSLVLSWGGHISTHFDWGSGTSATAISGSPYHTRLISIDGKGGNQDRSLSASAVIGPIDVTVIKNGTPSSTDLFNFSISNPPGGTLDGDGDHSNGISTTFQLEANGDSQHLGMTAAFGTYQITETETAGWAFQNATCTVDDPTLNPELANCANPARGVCIPFIMGGGGDSPLESHSITCTFNNERQIATLTVIKHVVNDDGGQAVAGNFTINVSGTNPSPSSFAGAESPGTDVMIMPGAYNVTEPSPVAGYSVSYSADCTGTIAAGGHKTCTVTNDDQAAHLIIIKNLINNNGGTKTVSDFSGTVTGVTVSGGNNWTGTASPGLNLTLMSVGAYNVTENPDADYDTTYSADCSGTIALGQTKTCTVTNNDKAPQLTVIKHVVNDDGGSATASQWTMDVTATNPSNNHFAGAEAPGVTITLNAGAYSVDESGGVAGYTKTLGANCSGTIALGESKTCTITNDDQQATLTLVKHVTNDDGGTLQVSDFPLFINGNPATSGVAVDVNPGNYTATETNQPGYVASAWSGDCAANGTVSIALGENKTCHITNDDQGATLTLVKHVTNDNGGTLQVSDFPLFINGNPATSGVAVELDAGSYTASETNRAGYAPSAWSGDCAANGSVTLALGEHKTCHITNDDIAPSLTLIKQVVGSGNPTAWTLTATGPTGFSGTTPASSAILVPSFDAGTYTLAESGGIAGYLTTGLWSCVGDVNVSGVTSVTLGIGQSTTCTIVNSQPSSIVISKRSLSPLGACTTFPFTSNIGSASSFSINTCEDNDQIPSNNDRTVAHQTIPVVPGGSYTFAETLAASPAAPNFGWGLNTIACTSSTGLPPNVTVQGNSVSINTIGGGETVTCTFTNTQAQMPLVKLFNSRQPICSLGSPINISAIAPVGGPLSVFQVTATGHGLTTGDVVAISGVAGTEANFINGNWFVTVTGANTFTLDNSQSFGGTINVTAPPTVTKVTECHDPLTLETVPHFEFRFYLHDAGANPHDGLQPYTGSAVVPPPAELPGVTEVPFSICEMTSGVGADAYTLRRVTINLWDFNGAIDPLNPDSSQTKTLYTIDDGNETAVCFDGLIPAGTQRWEINANNVKAGGTRTIGYWANWTTCDGKGNQVAVAAKNGGPDEGFWLLDDVLDYLNIPNVTPPTMTCAEGVDLLKKSSIGNPDVVGDGTKRANDAAYGMVAQLIAAEANYAAGALQCGNTTQAINQAITLLSQINFTGQGSYLPPKGGSYPNSVRTYALQLASLLDTYNNLHDIGDCGLVPVPPTPVVP